MKLSKFILLLLSFALISLDSTEAAKSKARKCSPALKLFFESSADTLAVETVQEKAVEKKTDSWGINLKVVHIGQVLKWRDPEIARSKRFKEKQTPLVLVVTVKWTATRVQGMGRFDSGVAQVRELTKARGGGYTASKTISAINLGGGYMDDSDIDRYQVIGKIPVLIESSVRNSSTR